MLLPSALGFSPHPPVSVFGTGICHTIAAFLGTRSLRFPTPFRSTSRLLHCTAAFPAVLLLRLYRASLSRHAASACVPTVLMTYSTGISTCCPSATSFDLALGPDSPRADQLYPGNLGYPAGRIPTFLSLLIPAFSLRYGPLLLTVQLPPVSNAPLPMRSRAFPGFGGVFQPRTFSARDLSTSELLRTL